MRRISIDGRPLSYPGTGLALNVVEYIRNLSEKGYGSNIYVFVDSNFRPESYDLDPAAVNWVRIEFGNRYPKTIKFLAKAFGVNDYIERLFWGRMVSTELKKHCFDCRHFIPYSYNYGKLEENVVLIPDLISDNVPVLDPKKPWLWNLRHRLPFKAWLREHEKKLVVLARHIVAISEFVGVQVEKELHFEHDRISVIPLAAPRWLETASNANDVSVKAHLQLPDQYVLYAGGFGVRKNLPMLLRIAGQLHEIDPSFRLVMVGLDKELLASPLGSVMRAELAKDHIAQATILPGHISYRELASVIRQSAFTVYPSFNEGFGLPVVEAAACGKLCLVGDNSSLKEVQANDQLRIRADDEDSWTKKILFYWQNPEAARKLGQQSLEMGLRYSWRRSASDLWQLLQNLT